MFDLDGRVRQWRERQERTSSLSPRELDELEDHLRARVDLEMELNAVLGPQQAFAIARHDLGEAAALEKEFAKVGKPRWRRWLVAGWTAYVAAWFLPVFRIELFGFGDVLYGHELFRDSELLVFVPVHLAMLMSTSALWGGRIARARWMRWLLGCTGGLVLGFMVAAACYAVSTDGLGVLSWFVQIPLAIWSWGASMVCAAAGLRLRAKEWASATPKRVSA